MMRENVLFISILFISHICYTFTTKFAVLIEESLLLSILVIHWRILLKIIKTQMISQFSQLLISQFFPEKVDHFLNFTTQILRKKLFLQFIRN